MMQFPYLQTILATNGRFWDLFNTTKKPICKPDEL